MNIQLQNSIESEMKEKDDLSDLLDLLCAMTKRVGRRIDELEKLDLKRKMKNEIKDILGYIVRYPVGDILFDSKYNS